MKLFIVELSMSNHLSSCSANELIPFKNTKTCYESVERGDL